MAEQSGSVLGNGLKSILKSGFQSYVKEVTGKGIDHKTWLQKQAGQTWKEGMKFINDPEVQEDGAELVSHVIKGQVAEMKHSFSDALSDVSNWTKNDGDTRSTYEKARALLGNNATDRWYTKIMKGVGAGVLSMAVPVASFVGSIFESKFTGRETERGAIRKSLSSIISGLLGIATQPKSA